MSYGVDWLMADHEFVYMGLTGKIYNIDLDWVPKSGGEGTVFRSLDGKFVKIYHDKILSSRGHELETKLIYMCSHTPSNNVLPYLSWPIDVIRKGGTFKGFVMNPHIGFSKVGELCSFDVDKPKEELLMLNIALNICILTDAIHSAGYVIGDFHPDNIGFLPDHINVHVCLYDNDSFQFTDTEGRTFKCDARCEEYMAPEVIMEIDRARILLEVADKDPDNIKMRDLPTGWTVETDLFALAVHVFKLMFNAYNPFDSIPTVLSSTPLPELKERIRNCWYLFGPDHKPSGPYVPPADHFPPYIMGLFERAFSKPESGSHRPTAAEWKRALLRYVKEVKRCKSRSEHIYWKYALSCPYCDAIGLKVTVSTVRSDRD